MQQRVSSRAFTLIELLVVIAIIAILASMLLPALSRARYTAQKSACQSQMKQMGMGLSMYGSDSNGYTPSEGVNGGDFGLAYIAGRQTWGISRPYTNASGPNAALGLGKLVVNKYIVLDLTYCPSVKSGTWWDRRIYFGKAFQTNFTDAWGVPWTSGGWVSGSNYYMDSDYAYRAGDWTDIVKQRRSAAYTNEAHTEYPDHAIIVDGRSTNHQQIFGANVLWGDSSVSWWRDNQMYSYTLSGTPSYPVSTTFHGFLLTYLMDMADQGRNR
jgi:prepilin-type N-terminal cleavage/methylation domain-containing protein